MDMMGNIYDNVRSILGILQRQNDDNDFVLKACSLGIILQEKDTLRALSKAKIYIFTYVYFVYDPGHKYVTLL